MRFAEKKSFNIDSNGRVSDDSKYNLNEHA